MKLSALISRSMHTHKKVRKVLHHRMKPKGTNKFKHLINHSKFQENEKDPKS